MQLLTKLAKLKKANEKLKKSSQKRKRDYGSNSDDSDSSWWGGSGSKWGCNCRNIKLTNNSQLSSNTTPCLGKATNHSNLNLILNLMNTDIVGNPIQENLTTNHNNLDLNNDIISNEVLSPTQKNLLQQGTMPK